MLSYLLLCNTLTLFTAGFKLTMSKQVQNGQPAPAAIISDFNWLTRNHPPFDWYMVCYIYLLFWFPLRLIVPYWMKPGAQQLNRATICRWHPADNQDISIPHFLTIQPNSGRMNVNAKHTFSPLHTHTHSTLIYSYIRKKKKKTLIVCVCVLCVYIPIEFVCCFAYCFSLSFQRQDAFQRSYILMILRWCLVQQWPASTMEWRSPPILFFFSSSFGRCHSCLSDV
jgi:hypothetical protein